MTNERITEIREKAVGLLGLDGDTFISHRLQLLSLLEEDIPSLLEEVEQLRDKLDLVSMLVPNIDEVLEEHE